jgi:hypothetical protein
VADPRDHARHEPGPQLVDSQHVQHIIPGQALQHAQKDAFRVEMPDLAAFADGYLVQLVWIDGVIPDSMPHDFADTVFVLGRDHGALRVEMYVNPS